MIVIGCLKLISEIDMIIITNGTLLAIQNMTWNGQLGFQNAPNESIVIDLPELQYLDAFEANYGTGLGAQGVMGIQVRLHMTS